MLEAFCLATLLLVVITFLPLSRHPHWVIRGLDFPRLQFAVLAASLLLLQWLLLDPGEMLPRLLIAVTLLCLIWQMRSIVPYTTLWPTQVKTVAETDELRELSVITANVLATNRDANRLLALVEQNCPDVLVTLESDQWWQSRLDTLTDSMPYTMKCPLDNLYGMHVYSRLPLSQCAIEYLVEEAVPSMHALLQLRSGDRVRIHFLHPAPPSPTENPESAERDAELVIVARSVANSEYPVVITGDLNDVAWSPTTRLFLKISGLLDPRLGRGLFNTFHAGIPFLRWPLDHLFHSKHFGVRELRRLPPIGSDHFALYARLFLLSDPARNGEGPDPSAGDQDEARQIAERRDARVDDVPQPGDQH